MSLERATQLTRRLLIAMMLLALCGVAMGSETATADTRELLMRGSAQVVLAVCLLATTGALCICFRLLVTAYKERILKLEEELSRHADVIKAQVEFARELGELRRHCMSSLGIPK